MHVARSSPPAQSDNDFELMVKYVSDLKPEERILVSGSKGGRRRGGGGREAEAGRRRLGGGGWEGEAVWLGRGGQQRWGCAGCCMGDWGCEGRRQLCV